MKAKFRVLPFYLFLVTNLACCYSQGSNESGSDNLAPEIFEDPVVEIDHEFETQIIGEKIIIPEETIGFVYVVFDSPQEKDYSCCPTCEGDFQNNLLVDIPKSKILRYACDGRIHKRMLIEGKLQYFTGLYDEQGYPIERGSINKYRQNDSLSLKMNGYQYNEYLTIKSALKEGKDKVDLIYDLDSIVVVPYGFHESFKKVVETALNKEISGNVAGFQIGTVKEIFKLNEEGNYRIKN
jgi:hypothetical protein